MSLKTILQTQASDVGGCCHLKICPLTCRFVIYVNEWIIFYSFLYVKYTYNYNLRYFHAFVNIWIVWVASKKICLPVFFFLSLSFHCSLLIASHGFPRTTAPMRTGSVSAYRYARQIPKLYTRQSWEQNISLDLPNNCKPHAFCKHYTLLCKPHFCARLLYTDNVIFLGH